MEDKENSLDPSLYKLYLENIESEFSRKSFICTTTPMNLIYTGLIISQIPSAKVIYCYRNPLDHIKELYKKNMGNKHTYSCSIVESAKLWIEVYSLMEKYKKRYGSKIYFQNYDNLISNTEETINDLISWIGWENHNKYLEPNLDPTTIRLSNRLNPRKINRNELFSWKNYSELLQPVIQIFNNSKKFKYLIKK